MKRFSLITLMCLIMSSMALAKDVKVSSPDGSLTVTVGIDGGKAWYQVNRAGNEVIVKPSALGFVLKGGDFKDVPWTLCSVPLTTV